MKNCGYSRNQSIILHAQDKLVGMSKDVSRKVKKIELFRKYIFKWLDA